MLPDSSRYRRSLRRPQPLKPADQLPYIGGRRSGCLCRSLDALCIANCRGNAFAAAVVGSGICLPIAFEMCFKLAYDLSARGGPAGCAMERLVRVSEMEQKPVLEAGCRDGGADFRSAFPPARVLFQPVQEFLNFRGSFVVVEDAPDFVQVGIPLSFPLNRCRDARGPPLPALRASDGHTRKIEVAGEGQEVAGFSPGCFAQDQYARQARPRSRSSPSGTRCSSPELPWGHRALILRQLARRHSGRPSSRAPGLRVAAD